MNWTRPVFVRAYAKINLTLEVIGRRADGYHELASVMQTVSLHDTLALRPAPAGTRTLDCDVAELAGADNLALRAAHLLAAEAGGDPGVAIELRKEVPARGGLGGGSGDAAAVLMALERLWRLRLPAGRLTELAARLGSDVPFFLAGGTALVGGRGERVEPLPDGVALWLVLLRPPVAIATSAAFAALTPRDFAGGAASAALAAALRRGEPPDRASTGRPDPLVNTFEPSVLRDYPAVARAREALIAAGAPVVRLSGSGPTLFAPFAELAPAAETWRRLRAEGHETWLARTVSRAEVIAGLAALDAAASDGA
jgi:4-diphosphocytidyl-2-C-methyl-D-erythritol kinase